MTTPNQLPSPEASVDVLSPAEIAGIAARLTPGDLLETSTVSVIARLLTEHDRRLASVGPDELSSAAKATDDVRDCLWRAMGSSPTNNTEYLSAAVLFEAVLCNYSFGDLSQKIGLLVGDYILGLSKNIRPGEPCILAWQNDRDSSVYSVGVTNASGLCVGLVESGQSAGWGRVKFAIGVNENELTVPLDEATVSWLDEADGGLDDECKCLSVVCGESETTAYLKQELQRRNDTLSYLARLPSYYGGFTDDQRKAFARGIRNVALGVAQLIQVAGKLGITPESMGIPDREWKRYNRVVRNHVTEGAKV